jgi:hypothetical protein
MTDVCGTACKGEAEIANDCTIGLYNRTGRSFWQLLIACERDHTYEHLPSFPMIHFSVVDLRYGSANRERRSNDEDHKHYKNRAVLAETVTLLLVMPWRGRHGAVFSVS